MSKKFVSILVIAVVFLVINLQLSPSRVYLPIIIYLPTYEEQLLNLINAERRTRGLTTLSTSSMLMQVAEAHSQDMINRHFFGHINPDGLNAGDRLNNVGYKWNSWGEVIGEGLTTPTAMFNGWMNSPSHRANLLNPSFSEIGPGYSAGGIFNHYWTAVLAMPQ